MIPLALRGDRQLPLTVWNDAAASNNGVRCIIGEPVLVAAILLDERISRRGHLLGVVLNSGTKVEVLFKVHVHVKLNLRGSKAGCKLGRLGGIGLGIDVLPG